MDPLTYNEVRTRPSLEERLESIISGAALMADSFCTRDDRRLKIVEECNAVRQALQDLLTEYMDNVSICFCLYECCAIYFFSYALNEWLQMFTAIEVFNQYSNELEVAKIVL